MDSVQLRAWVKQECRQVSFSKGGDASITKAAMKSKLIQRQPKHKQEIRELVNSIYSNRHREAESRGKMPPNTPKAPNAQPPVQSTMSSQSPTRLPINQAELAHQMELRNTSSQRSDSGLASSPEDVENKTSVGMSSWIKSLGPVEYGGSGKAASGTNPSSIFRFGKTEEAAEASRNVFQFGKSAEKPKTPSSISRFGKSADTLETPRTIEPQPSSPKTLRISELRKFLDELPAINFDFTQDDALDTLSTQILQLKLLHTSSPTDENEEETSPSAIQNAVLFSADVLQYNNDHLPQYGLLGSSAAASSWNMASDSRLFLNTNIPFSAFVCGVQGSGKSHTTACIIENCLIPSPILGVLPKPLSALVFNFAEYASASSFRPCELAFLGSPSAQFPNQLGVKKVNVLVSPSNYPSLKRLYTQIPGVVVQPFKLRPEDLNISTMLTLMSVDQTQAAPLYMGIVTKILRDMASKSADSFNYPEFRRRLDDAGLDRKQEDFLGQRLDLLESFMDLDGSTTRPAFAAGEITILDLSCPFVDASTACVMFKIGMSLYLESDPTVGKAIVLDEAHKYMTDTPASKALTQSLMGVIRQQRHYGARVIISTQEPSISPKLIDLCSITIMHRFSSPEWLDVLKRHILVSDEDGKRGNEVGLLRDIMRLKTGEAMVFAPSAVVGMRDEDGGRSGADELFRMRMRKRVTWDGGRSIVCV